jgi:hypothetical protein
MRTILSAFFCTLLISSCASEREVSNEVRYKQISTAVLTSKASLWLHKPDNRTASSRRSLYQLMDNNEDKERVIQKIPPGQRFNAHKVMRVAGSGSSWDYLVGDFELQGRRYPFLYYLGTSVYPDRWRQIFESFEISSAKQE